MGLPLCTVSSAPEPVNLQPFDLWLRESDKSNLSLGEGRSPQPSSGSLCLSPVARPPTAASGAGPWQGEAGQGRLEDESPPGRRL